MLPTHSLLLPVLARPCSSPRPPRPITPVLTGGKVTYSGGVSGTLKSSSPDTDEFYNEKANIDFSATSTAVCRSSTTGAPAAR
jgi:hypothetical protein